MDIGAWRTAVAAGEAVAAAEYGSEALWREAEDAVIAARRAGCTVAAVAAETGLSDAAVTRMSRRALAREGPGAELPQMQRGRRASVAAAPQ